jgi:ABC-type glycerol-3-phosphate transport system permease component
MDKTGQSEYMTLPKLETARRESDKLAVSVLLEDFKARWQELLNFENENNRWSTLYVTALILVISWVINNTTYQNIEDIFHRGENSYFIISLALINALYTFSMVLKGYQVQQIALYLYEEVGSRVSFITGQPFNSWEKWRRERFQSRERKGKPEFIRMIYYSTISLLPLAVSITILVLYGVYELRRHRWYGGHNLYFYIVSTLVLSSLYAAYSTTKINYLWEQTLKLQDQGAQSRSLVPEGRSSDGK